VHKSLFLLERKKSKFISYLFPYKNFELIKLSLIKEHSKASHFVYAYRYFNEYDQVVENSSDDGEPRGTSGKPSLAVLNGFDAINTAVITVRYFGGIKLGPGGLVKAYSDAVNSVCDAATFYKYEKLEQKILTVSHKKLSDFLYQLQMHDIQVLDKKFNDNVTLTLEATLENFNNFDAVHQ
jgi:uncharacterized YigZ family protein